MRAAFRRRLLELHPDKGGAVDSQALDQVLRAYEVLDDADRREAYDRSLALIVDKEEKWTLPHILESTRPADRARAVLHLLVTERSEEALVRLNSLGEDPREYLLRFLEIEEFIDTAFLIGEAYERTGLHFEALRWYEVVVDAEAERKRHRPCFEETLDRAKRLLLQKVASDVDPRVGIELLGRAERLGLDRYERAEVHRRRAECHLALDQKDEARMQLGFALEENPRIKGLKTLKRALGA